MPFPIADTHTHLYFSSFDPDRNEVIQRNQFHGVNLEVQIGCDEVSSLAALQLAKTHENFYATLGLHPADVLHCFSEKKEYRPSGFENYQTKAKNFDALFAFFEELFRMHEKKIVGFGETGFDLYHENSPEILNVQTNVFERHLKLCLAYDRLAVLHIRNAKKEFFHFLEHSRQKNFRAVLHCFSEDAEFARIMTEKYHFFLGIGGVSTYPNAQNVRDAISAVPIEFLVTETDSPFLTPQSNRKTHKRNESNFLTEVVELIAHIKKMPVEECAKILFENAKRMYRIL